MNYAGKFGSGGLDPVSGVDVGPGLHDQFLSFGKLQVDKVSTHAPADAIIIPDANLLFNGDFKRSGSDLIVSGGDREVVLHDYFRGEKRAALASPDGAHLTGDVVSALTGHTQFAQAGGATAAAVVIGHVTKLSGNATAIRNGVAIILNQGDNVNKGDVVQSGSDSTLGITFIDGTVFGLASNARMVLNEMVYDPNSSDNRSLISLVQGTISFVAGATAKKGDMKVDTPVATMGIRGTAVLVEIDFDVSGTGLAPPAKFQVLVEPDGTTGSYILFDKTTLTPIATVNRAGTQTIINGQGAVTFNSSVQLSPDAQKIISDVFSLKFTDLNNPNTRLTNNFTDSIVPENQFLKLASNDTSPMALQFMIIPDRVVTAPEVAPPPRLTHIPGPPEAGAVGGAFVELLDRTGSATVNSVSGSVSYYDVNVGDIPSVSAQFSTFTYQDADGANVTATLTAEQTAAIRAVQVPLTVTQDPAGRNFGTAIWSYDARDGAFDFLAEGETLRLTYLARVDNNYAPNNETSFVPFTIVITGTNDRPTISATAGELTEQPGTGNTTIDTITGTITFADADLTDRPVVTTAISETNPFSYHDAEGRDITANLTPAQLEAILATEVPLSVVQGEGNTHNGTATWTYSIEDSKFDFMGEGETLTLNYVATVDDGHGGVVSTVITVTIRGADVVVVGTNDEPTVTATGAAFAELSTPEQPNPTGSEAPHEAAGTITFTDVDLTDRPVASAAFTSFSHLDASGVEVTLLTDAQLAAIARPLTVVPSAENANNGSASWSYSVPDSAFDFLAAGEVLTLTYTATVDDGHGGVVHTPITIEVTGSNDTAAFTGEPQAVTISEDDLGSPTLAEIAGAITFTDADLTDTHSAAITGVTASGAVSGLANGQIDWLTLGQLTDSTGGVQGAQDWSFSAPPGAFDYLAEGQSVTLTYTVEVDDHHGGVVSQQVAVTIDGSNDAPSILGATDPAPQAIINNAGPTFIEVLSPGVTVNSLGMNTETFDQVAAGSTANNGAGHGNFYSEALGATFSGSGRAGVVNGSSAATAAPYVGPAAGGQDQTNYLSIGGGSETITFTSQMNTFGLYWGSLDSFNSVKFYDGDTLVASYTGAQFSPLFPSGNQTSFSSNGYVQLSHLPLFDMVVLSSPQTAFEIDNISAGYIPESDGFSPVTGTMTVHDSDIGDPLTAFVVGNATFTYNGSATIPGNIDISSLLSAANVTFDTAPSNGGTVVLHWTYQPLDADFGFLHEGDVLTINYFAEVSDGHGSAGHQPLTITLVGSDGEPGGQSNFASEAGSSGAARFVFSEAGQDPVAVNGTSGDDIIHATASNDILTGGAGADQFVFAPHPTAAVHTITDFKPGEDHIDLRLFSGEVDAANIDSWLHAHAAQSTTEPADVTVTIGNDVLTLKNIALANLHASDFIVTPHHT